MKFESTHIKGKGRGKPMGFPTINLKIPESFELKDGIYAAKVTIDSKVFISALHYGLVPTFDESDQSLEVFLLGSNNNELEDLDDKIIKVEIIKYLRPVIKFNSKEELIAQIKKDVKEIESLISAF